METIRTDCLVIGSGLAGSTYAYQASRAGLSTVLISGETAMDECNSKYAQGGIVYHTDDSPASRELLLADIDTATAGAANPEAVAAVVNYGARLIKELLIDELHVPFDRGPDGELLLTREAAHSAARIVFSKDRTGAAILEAMHRGVTGSPGITVLEGHVAVDLLTPSHHSMNYLDKYRPLSCVGAYVFDVGSGEVKAVVARKTVLATGGLGQIYLYSTNFPSAYGHGVAMAYRIGARVIDLEYVQFHPTVFSKKGYEPFLISEAVRGEGGILVNAAGRPFMDSYHPLKSLAPRDVIARSINSELTKSGASSVFIDLSAMQPAYIRDRFPTIYAHCRQNGVDITREPIPVVPAAHYACGGVYTNVNGQTSVPNLSAIGEAACTGFHGANRLASTSLLECLAMGGLAARRDVAEIRAQDLQLPEIRQWQGPELEADEDLVAQDLSLIKNTMWNYVGLVRTTKRLERATDILRQLRTQVTSFYRDCAISKPLLDLRNAVQTALLVVYAASQNHESRGAHFRDDAARG